MRYSIPLAAGIPQKQFFRGRCLAVLDAGAAGEVTITVYGTDVQDGEDFGAVGKNFSLFYPDRTFTGVELTAAVDTVLEIIVSNARVETLDGANLTASIDAAQLPLPVAATRGDTALNPFYVSGAILGDTPAATITDHATAAATDVAAAVLAADATRLEAVFYNQGPDPVALGMVGITWAKRAVVLEVGESWVESRAAAKAWYAITAATKTATLGMQERKA